MDTWMAVLWAFLQAVLKAEQLDTLMVVLMVGKMGAPLVVKRVYSTAEVMAVHWAVLWEFLQVV